MENDQGEQGFLSCGWWKAVWVKSKTVSVSVQSSTGPVWWDRNALEEWQITKTEWRDDIGSRNLLAEDDRTAMHGLVSLLSPPLTAALVVSSLALSTPFSYYITVPDRDCVLKENLSLSHTQWGQPALHPLSPPYQTFFCACMYDVCMSVYLF